MSGINFSGKGGPGPATITSWFGAYLPDNNYNMIIPGRYDKTNPGGSGNFPSVNSDFAGNFISQWVPWNTAMGGGAAGSSISLGAAVTAPDGTMTANKIVEGTTNSSHMMVATSAGTRTPVIRRLAVIAAAGERTRMFLALTNAESGVGPAPDGTPGFGQMGVWTIFDLAGGQIGRAGVAFGDDSFSEAPWGPVHDEIKFLGTFGGRNWYLCIIDVQTQNNTFFNSFAPQVGTDAGSGTGALNITYTGNGTSGIYVWRTNVLPTRAWGAINGTSILFEDFLSSAGVDINNTKNPGFNIYTDGNWPFGAHTGSPPIADFGGPNSIYPPVPSSALDFSVNSVMHVKGTSATNSKILFTPQTAAYTGPAQPNSPGFLGPNGGNYVGTIYQPPVLVEVKWNFDYSKAFGGQAVAYWAPSMNGIMTNNYNWPTNHTEYDYEEAGQSVDNPAWGQSGYFSQYLDFTNSIQIGPVSSYRGIPAWNANQSYGNAAGFNNLRVSYLGLLYDAQVATVPVGTVPTAGLPNWALTVLQAQEAPLAQTMMFDFNSLQVYTTLWLADLYSPTEVIHFFNGSLCGYVIWTGLQRDKSFWYPLWLQGSQARDTFYDYVRIVK